MKNNINELEASNMVMCVDWYLFQWDHFTQRWHRTPENS